MLDLASFDGILCDLDGVLVDSAAATQVAYDEWADRHELDRETVRATYPGTPSRQVVAQLAPHLDPAEESAALLEAELRTGDDVRALPGAAALMADPPTRFAVVTSCERELAASRFAATGLTPPAVIVTADDVTTGKPGPEPYLAGARALGVDPARCVVLEDSPAGVAAGKAAGATVFALLTSHDAGQLSDADELIEDLSALVR